MSFEVRICKTYDVHVQIFVYKFDDKRDIANGSNTFLGVCISLPYDCLNCVSITSSRARKTMTSSRNVETIDLRFDLNAKSFMTERIIHTRSSTQASFTILYV